MTSFHETTHIHDSIGPVQGLESKAISRKDIPEPKNSFAVINVNVVHTVSSSMSYHSPSRISNQFSVNAIGNEGAPKIIINQIIIIRSVNPVKSDHFYSSSEEHLLVVCESRRMKFVTSLKTTKIENAGRAELTKLIIE
ncbi:hypothetical protein CERZMDRAFT_93443 [Cercospora zeae-maydis SCOH1-5]|uniref:Uncharacterized protein n=1 Tax=Cercospora zeae-maydis SCOH1-5 TaxID=717836 RepID=A0A6A6FRR9_9PEZI|nr:hypothetical protein CERZMDRAFT_93443 [Cercospora zeae-maydis SCOH1-5]